MLNSEYMTVKMGVVGAGSSDIRQAQAICDNLSSDERDILDCMDNLGVNQKMLPQYQAQVDNLKAQYSDDDLMVLARYVATRRNSEEY